MNNKIEIALFEPQIPQNVGTILRTADCLGVLVNIILPCGFVFGGSLMKRAGMDYLGTAAYKLYDDFQSFYSAKQLNNQKIILVTTKSEQNYYNYDFKDSDVILMGSETAGVPKEVHEIVDSRVTIPMLDNKRSLNLAISTGIVMSKALFG
ncbi:TrmH family RNA methyltransferase [Rickettsiales bacterium LUAb2]